MSLSTDAKSASNSCCVCRKEIRKQDGNIITKGVFLCDDCYLENDVCSFCQQLLPNSELALFELNFFSEDDYQNDYCCQECLNKEGLTECECGTISKLNRERQCEICSNNRIIDLSEIVTTKDILKQLQVNMRFAASALITLLDMQTSDEREEGKTKHRNSAGFSATDANELTAQAKTILDLGYVDYDNILDYYTRDRLKKYCKQLLVAIKGGTFKDVAVVIKRKKEDQARTREIYNEKSREEDKRRMGEKEAKEKIEAMKTLVIKVDKDQKIVRVNFDKYWPLINEIRAVNEEKHKTFVFDGPSTTWSAELNEVSYDAIMSFDIPQDKKDTFKGEAWDTVELLINEKKKLIALSMATDAAIEIPAPAGLTYLGYQKAGIKFAMERPGTLLADEMGLGKTIEAIGVINADTSIKKVLIVCPASLKLNWWRELEKWLTRKMSIVSMDSKKGGEDADIQIVNYDVLSKVSLRDVYDLLIVDEAHYIKNDKAARTKSVMKISADRTILLTGTPIMNRPIELFSLLIKVGMYTKDYFWTYAKRYCAAYQDTYGWNFKGASNLDELQEKLRTTCMIRRLKKDVLTELPPKRYQIVEIPANDRTTQQIKKENTFEASYATNIKAIQMKKSAAEIGGDKEAYKNAVDQLRECKTIAFREITKLRHETSLLKAPFVAERVQQIVEGGEVEKVVVFAHHHDVVDHIKTVLGGIAVVVTGETPLKQRDRAIQEFQNNPAIKVFIGSIGACGVGITLTAASYVVFAELDWTPSNMTQAEDRLHRKGQKNSVLVQHFVVDGSIDAKIAKMLLKKKEVVNQALEPQYLGLTPESIINDIFNVHDNSDADFTEINNEEVHKTGTLNNEDAAPFGFKADGSPRKQPAGPGRPPLSEDERKARRAATKKIYRQRNIAKQREYHWKWMKKAEAKA